MFLLIFMVKILDFYFVIHKQKIKAFHLVEIYLIYLKYVILHCVHVNKILGAKQWSPLNCNFNTFKTPFVNT